MQSLNVMSNTMTETLPTIIISCGLIANVLVMIVLSAKSFKTLPLEAATLINILAFNDILVLITVLFTHYSYIFKFEILPLFYNTFTCKILSFATGYLPSVSSWILSFMSIERLFILKFASVNFFKKMRFKLVVVVLIYLFNFFLYLEPLIMNTHSIQEMNNSSIIVESCLPNNYENVFIQAYITLISSILVPFFIMLICTIIIIYTLFLNYNQSRIIINTEPETKRNFQFSITILALNLIFILFNTPYFIAQTLIYYDLRNIDINFLYSSNMFYLLQFGVNFLIYMLVYLRFRKVFCYLFFNLELNNS